MQTEYKTLKVATKGPVAYVTIDRPDSLNALNRLVLDELHNCVDEIAKNRDLRVVVLSGSGEKAFVAGADIKEMSSLEPDLALEFARYGQNLTKKLEYLPQIVIARVHGFALGGGCELAMACDIIVASDRAKFGQPEVNLGLVPGFGGTQRLVKLIGLTKAMDVLCGGKILSGQEAYEAGLVARICTPESIDAEVNRVIEGVLRGGPQAIALTKKLSYGAQHWELGVGLEIEAKAFRDTFKEEESRAGMQAFISKTPAPFAVKL